MDKFEKILFGTILLITFIFSCWFFSGRRKAINDLSRLTLATEQIAEAHKDIANDMAKTRVAIQESSFYHSHNIEKIATTQENIYQLHKDFYELAKEDLENYK